MLNRYGIYSGIGKMLQMKPGLVASKTCYLGEGIVSSLKTSYQWEGALLKIIKT